MAALLTATITDPVNRQCNLKCSTRLKHPITIMASKVIPISNRHRPTMGTIISTRVQRATANKHLIKPSSSTSPSTMTCGLAYWYEIYPKQCYNAVADHCLIADPDLPWVRRGLRSFSARLCFQQEWKRRERHIQQPQQLFPEHQHHHSFRVHTLRCLCFLMALFHGCARFH